MPKYLTLTDEELFSLIKNDNEQAFAELYNRYKRPLVAFALKKIDANEVEDIVHDLFAKLWTNRDNIEINQQLRSYLYRSLRNRIIDFISHQIHEKKYVESIVLFGETFINKTDHSLREHMFLEELNIIISKYNCYISLFIITAYRVYTQNISIIIR